MARGIKVFEVLYDTEGWGPTGDGTVIARFRDRAAAADFARGETCYGRPAAVDAARTVSVKLARRWGVA